MTERTKTARPTLQERERDRLAKWRRERKAKPFSVWPSDRERPLYFAGYAEAEAYAKRAIKRLEGREAVRIGHEDGQVATVHVDWRDLVVVDLTDLGGRFV